MDRAGIYALQFLKAAPINEIAKIWKDITMDVETMLREHREFVEAYHKAGVEVEFLEPDEERPNSVFSRDFGGCVKEGYIMGNFKLDMCFNLVDEHLAVSYKEGLPEEFKKLLTKREIEIIDVPGEQPKDKPYIKLNANESSMPPSPKVFEAVSKSEIWNMSYYADPHCHEFRKAVAEVFKGRQYFCQSQ